MAEGDVVERTQSPVTAQSLLVDLRSIGVRGGMILFVQSSLSSIGWVCGGPVTVIGAILKVLGPGGTLVMPCMSSDYSDPKDWEHPPVPMEWWDTIRRSMPAFDKDKTPARNMGAVADALRCWPGTLRSDHPLSLAAYGKHALELVAVQPWDFPLADGSPLDRCSRMGGYALLIGTERNTTLHLAEHRARIDKRTRTNGAPVTVSGKRVWKAYHDYDDYTAHFPRILEDFSKTASCTVGRIGYSDAYFFKQEDIVSFGAKWLEREL